MLLTPSLLLVVALGLAGCAGGPAARTKGLLLADQGRALLPIVISEQAMTTTNTYKWGYVTPVTGIRQVADDLAAHLQRITGAKFAVTTGDVTRGIVLGTLEDFPALKKKRDIVRALKIRDRFDGIEALAIRTEPQRLLLVGNTILGASHASSRFLE
ncbi:hypothetical protein HQ590_16435, partial [bacterium]|nr:hypothetical protein [bacterium]